MASKLEHIASRLEAVDTGEAFYTREDVERIVESRLGRERKKRRAAEAELEELLAKLGHEDRS